MHLLFLGASGRTGQYAYKYALDQGHHVTVLVRKSSSVDPHDSLTIVEGSAMSQSDVDRAVSAAGIPVDSVLQLLNPQRASDNPWSKFLGPPRLLADATAFAARSLSKQWQQQQQQQRQQQQNRQPNTDLHKPHLVVLNAIGAGQSRAVAPWFAKMFFDHSNISKTYVDHDAVDAEIEENCGDDVLWTVAYGVSLTDGGRKPVKTFTLQEKGFGYRITRESLALWMVDAAAGKFKHDFDNKRIVVSN